MQQFVIEAQKALDLPTFLQEEDMPLLLKKETTRQGITSYYLYRDGYSTTYFLIEDNHEGEISVFIDGLATFDDYKFYPYLLDCLNKHLNNEALVLEGDTIYELWNEDEIQDIIGAEIAELKSALTVIPRWMLQFPIQPGAYIDTDLLAKYGVTLHSSTPRIYGYIQYLMKHKLLPAATAEEMAHLNELLSGLGEEIEVDVPQHKPIGKVKSWQTDGAETWESYAQEDVDLLLSIGEAYKKGGEVAGVVLNDLGTIYQEGIGIDKDGEQAAYWFGEAIKQGDRLYAPSNLGDLYRNGCETLPVSLKKAFKAYQQSEDPYAHYRVGQAYEEGWIGTPNINIAMEWYKKAAEEGHHLAIKRLEK